MKIDSSDVEIVTDLDADVEIIEASAESGLRGEAALAGLRPKKRLHDKTVPYTAVLKLFKVSWQIFHILARMVLHADFSNLENIDGI